MSSEDAAPLSIQRAQLAVDETIVALGGYWAPLANLARLFEECGELARAVNQAYGPKVVKAAEAPARAGEEVGDALYVLLVLANSLHLDAEAALRGALDRARDRAAGRQGGAGDATP
ncbi:MAG TPA: MazG nucleotide pyrophosphohydrolase domain-containing protein [Ktedonobacterales bacterium]|nr:MazG nucleotide pyrophosphohydrolase domain-containing protein [Ktedonobacterales bacterium]